MRRSSSITYIATPIGHLDAPHWRACMALPSGDTVVVIGLLLRDLAAKINRGGKLILPNSAPMDERQIAWALSRPETQVQYAVGVLKGMGIVTLTGVTICVTEPLLLEHCSRVAALALPDKELRKRLLGAARTRKCRAKKKADGNAEEAYDGNAAVCYSELQLIDIVDENNVTTYKKNKSKKKTTTSVDVDNSSLPNIQELIPDSAKSKRLQRILTVKLAHGADYVRRNIEYAIRNHNPKKGKLGGMICSALLEDYADFCLVETPLKPSIEAPDAEQGRDNNERDKATVEAEQLQARKVAAMQAYYSLPQDEQAYVLANIPEWAKCDDGNYWHQTATEYVITETVERYLAGRST